jgi:ethanolamine ammonia-lyase large subunit
MLNYQSTSFHDPALPARPPGLKRAPEFEDWLLRMDLTGPDGRLRPARAGHPLLQASKELAR